MHCLHNSEETPRDVSYITHFQTFSSITSLTSPFSSFFLSLFFLFPSVSVSRSLFISLFYTLFFPPMVIGKQYAYIHLSIFCSSEFLIAGARKKRGNKRVQSARKNSKLMVCFYNSTREQKNRARSWLTAFHEKNLLWGESRRLSLQTTQGWKNNFKNFPRQESLNEHLQRKYRFQVAKHNTKSPSHRSTSLVKKIYSYWVNANLHTFWKEFGTSPLYSIVNKQTTFKIF